MERAISCISADRCEDLLSSPMETENAIGRKEKGIKPLMSRENDSTRMVFSGFRRWMGFAPIANNLEATLSRDRFGRGSYHPTRKYLNRFPPGLIRIALRCEPTAVL